MNERNFIHKPLAIVRDKRLTPTERDYLCLIAQLEKASGCRASNNYFAKYFGVQRQSALEIISNLVKKNFVRRTEKKTGRKTDERILEIIDEVSRRLLLPDSRKLPARLAGNSDRVSRKFPTQTVEDIQRNKQNICFICRKPAENFIKSLGLYSCDECFRAYESIPTTIQNPSFPNYKISKFRLSVSQIENLILSQKAKLNLRTG
jgi:DNA-binding MarR family transcriptional regulator